MHLFSVQILFIYFRKRISLKPEMSLFVFVGDTIPSNAAMVTKIYEGTMCPLSFQMHHFCFCQIIKTKTVFFTWCMRVHFLLSLQLPYILFSGQATFGFEEI